MSIGISGHDHIKVLLPWWLSAIVLTPEKGRERKREMARQKEKVCHGWRKCVCLCVNERDIRGEYLVYTISLLNIAWWTASGRKQRAASDIDISICVWTCVCVSIFIIKVLFIHIQCGVCMCDGEKKQLIKQPSYLCSPGQWWRQEWRQSCSGRFQWSKSIFLY